MEGNFDIGDFKISEKVKKKLKDKKLLQKELEKGKTAQKILGFSNKSMAKFFKATRHLFDKERYVEAMNAFLFLVTLNPKNFDYWLGLGMSTQKCGKYEEAIDAYEMAAMYNLDSPIPYFYLAKCLFAVQDRENAINALDLAVEYAADQTEFADLKKQALKTKELLMGYE